jgi:capsular polysaccharide biosynthesis protein
MGASGTVTVAQFFRMLSRRRGTVLLTLVICTAVALGLYEYVTRSYQAVAVVDVTPDPGSGVDPKTVSTATEQRVMTSTQVAALAKRELKSGDTVDDLLTHVSVSSPLDSLVLDVTYTAPTASGAADGANAFANAYIQYRTGVAQDKINARSQTISDRIDQLTAKLDALSPTSGGRTALQNQISGLQSQLSSVRFSVIDNGQVIGNATPPTSASSPKLVIYGAGGIVLGLLLGIAIAVFRDRRDDSVRTVEDVETAVGAPTLAILPYVSRPRRRVAPLITVADPLGPEADAFRTLALKLVRPVAKGGRIKTVTEQPDGDHPPVVVIALLGVDHTDHAPLDLAVVLARRRVRTVLVATAKAHSYARNVLRRDAADPIPNLTLMSAGDELELDGLLRSEDSPLTAALDNAEVVLLDGVSVGHSSSALSLAQYADGCLVFATVGMTSKRALRSTAQELAQIGAYVSGTAVLYRGRRAPSTTSAGGGAFDDDDTVTEATGRGAQGRPANPQPEAKATQHGKPIIEGDLDGDDGADDAANRSADRAVRRRDGSTDRGDRSGLRR